MICRVKKYRALLLVWLSALSLSAPNALGASDLDIRVLIDTAQSMHDRDGDKLRQRALNVLISQLPEDGKGGIWTYANFTQRVANHERMSAMWKQVASIHIDNLSPVSRWQNPLNALTKVLWDLKSPDRQRVHLVWISNGSIKLADAGVEPQNRADLLAQLGNQMAAGRVVVHTMAVGPVDENDDLQLLSQLSQMTGGLHAVANNPQSAEKFAHNVVRLLQSSPEALVDSRGRFQVAPGTQRFTVHWPGQSKNLPGLQTPDGQQLDRLTSLPSGRWVQQSDFEMATIEKPAAGWWTLTGPKPSRVGVFGDLNVKVGGLRSPVVPSEEASALVELFHWGKPIVAESFLDLLDVRAWLVQNGNRQIMPVERDGNGFRAFFVNLDDGAYEFEVAAVGPTFRHKVIIPFEAKNPLQVEIREATGAQAAAWLSFSHTEVNYATVNAAAKFRKPPKLGVIVPGNSMPSGLWQINLPAADGIVEVAFTLAGNYMNGEGFFLKTQPITLTLPLAPGSVEKVRFDAAGKRISMAALALQEQHEAAFESPSASGSVPNIDPSNPALKPAAAATQEPPMPLLPWWFVALISTLSLGMGLLIWWFFRPQALSLDLSDITLENEQTAPG